MRMFARFSFFFTVSDFTDYAALHAETLPTGVDNETEGDALLLSLGWNAPDSVWRDWWIEVNWPCSGRDCLSLARLSVKTFRQFHGATNLDHLTYKAFNPVSHTDLNIPFLSSFPRVLCPSRNSPGPREQ